MGHINIARVILSGLVAGLIFNVGEFLLNDVVLAEQAETTLAGFDLPAPGGTAVLAFLLLGFYPRGTVKLAKFRFL